MQRWLSDCCMEELAVSAGSTPRPGAEVRRSQWAVGAAGHPSPRHGSAGRMCWHGFFYEYFWCGQRVGIKVAPVQHGAPRVFATRGVARADGDAGTAPPLGQRWLARQRVAPT